MAGPAQIVKRVSAVALSVAVRGVDLVRAVAPLRQRGRGSGVVLYYHAIKPHQRKRFADQMDELLKRAHPFPAGRPETMKKERRNVAVTFDDGFRSVVENALPELATRRIPFTMFVPSGCLGERPSWVRDPKHPSWEERVLSAEELRELAAHPLATLGSHTVTHPNFLKVDPACVSEELCRSKNHLEAATGRPVELFSFPHGAHTAAHLRQARKAGYQRVFTIEPSITGSEPDTFAIGRVAADPDDWPIEFRLKISGAYRWRSYLHRVRRTL